MSGWENTLGGSLVVFSVRTYGATGNGVTDDTAAIGRAAAAVGAAGGGILYFPQGAYLVSDVTSIPSNTWVLGAEGSTLKCGTTLANGGANKGRRLIELYLVNNVKISGLILDTTALNTSAGSVSAIRCMGATRFTITDNVILTCGAATACTAGAVTANPGATPCSDFWITDNKVTIALDPGLGGVFQGDGVIDHWWGCHTFTVRGNIVRGATIGQYGILVTGTSSDFTPYGGGGPFATPVYGMTITENQIYNMTIAGIWIQGRDGKAHDVFVTDNLVNFTTNFFAIALTDIFNFVCTGNQIHTSDLCGIRAYSENIGLYGDNGAQAGTISGNLIENANAAANASADLGSAISIRDNSSFIGVHDNIIYGAANYQYAVRVGTAPTEIHITGNEMAAGVAGAAVSSATASPTVSIPGATLYTPTLTARVNVTSSIANAQTQYKRDGTTVTVYGQLSVTATAAGDTKLGISLPAASNFTAAQDCSGVGAEANALMPARIFGDAANDEATLEFNAPGAGARVFSFTFQYQIK